MIDDDKNLFPGKGVHFSDMETGDDAVRGRKCARAANRTIRLKRGVSHEEDSFLYHSDCGNLGSDGGDSVYAEQDAYGQQSGAADDPPGNLSVNSQSKFHSRKGDGI